MKNKNYNRLSLEDFKQKNSIENKGDGDLEKISGGILGNCHVTVTTTNSSTVTLFGYDVTWLLGGSLPMPVK